MLWHFGRSHCESLACLGIEPGSYSHVSCATFLPNTKKSFNHLSVTLGEKSFILTTNINHLLFSFFLTTRRTQTFNSVLSFWSFRYKCMFGNCSTQNTDNLPDQRNDDETIEIEGKKQIMRLELSFMKCIFTPKARCTVISKARQSWHVMPRISSHHNITAERLSQPSRTHSSPLTSVSV